MLSKSVLRYGLYGLSLFTMVAVAIVDSVTRLDSAADSGASASGNYPVRMVMPPARLVSFADALKAGTAAGVAYPLRIELSTVPVNRPGFSISNPTRVAIPSVFSQGLPGPAPMVTVNSSSVASAVSLRPTPPLPAGGAATRTGMRDRLLPIHFDLSDPYEQSSGGSEIEIRKIVRIDGSDAGPANIRVNADSTLSISRDSLTALLTHAGRGDVATKLGNAHAQDGKFVSFNEMRDQGIDVHYDPASDRISVSK